MRSTLTSKLNWYLQRLVSIRKKRVNSEFFSEAKSRCKAATNLWADTDEEDNADSDDEDTHVETNVDQVGRGFPQEEVLTVIYYHSVQLKHT